MNQEYKLLTCLVLGIFLVLSVGFAIWQHYQNEKPFRDNKKNKGDDFGGWNTIDKDFNGN